MAKENKMPRSVNMILLGAAAKVLDLDIDTLSESVNRVFSSKGQAIVDMNIAALKIGEQA